MKPKPVPGRYARHTKRQRRIRRAQQKQAQQVLRALDQTVNADVPMVFIWGTGKHWTTEP